jgi:hypothetical protein
MRVVSVQRGMKVGQVLMAVARRKSVCMFPGVSKQSMRVRVRGVYVCVEGMQRRWMRRGVWR